MGTDAITSITGSDVVNRVFFFQWHLYSLTHSFIQEIFAVCLPGTVVDTESMAMKETEDSPLPSVACKSQIPHSSQ